MFPDFAKNLWRKIAAKTLGSILKFCFYFKQEILEQKYVSVHILQVRNAKFIEYGIIQKQGNITEVFCCWWVTSWPACYHQLADILTACPPEPGLKPQSFTLYAPSTTIVHIFVIFTFWHFQYSVNNWILKWSPWDTETLHPLVISKQFCIVPIGWVAKWSKLPCFKFK